MELTIYYALIVLTIIMLIFYIKLWTTLKTRVETFVRLKLSTTGRHTKKTLYDFSRTLEKNMNVIQALYDKFNESQGNQLELPNSIEWLNDNYYSIVEKEKALIDDDFKAMFYSLYRYQYKPTDSKIRVYSLAQKIVQVHEGRINDSIITNYLMQYQKHTILSEREIDILPKMILIAIIEEISNHSKELSDIYKQWERVNKIYAKRLDDENIIDKKLSDFLKSNDVPNTHFITRLYNVLRENGELNDTTYDLIISVFNKIGTDVSEIINHADNNEVQIGLIMGNLITSLKEDSYIDWATIQKTCSVVSDALMLDPAAIYPQMSLESQVLYRNRIVKLSESGRVSEVKIAQTARNLAHDALSDPSINSDEIEKCSHVGYYLVDDGEKLLLEALDIEDEKAIKLSTISKEVLKERIMMYLGFISIVSITLMFPIVILNPIQLSSIPLLQSIITVLIIIVPVSEIAITVVNHLTIAQTEPYIFPSLLLKEGIDKDMATFIVIPALLPSVAASEKVVLQLEQHYLLNRDENLYFGIVGAFKDSDQEHLETDKDILNYIIQSIKILNQKHGERFYLLQRKRLYNKSNNIWVGWERKRGAITELNEFLLGDKDTSFIYPLTVPDNLQSIKYVITLDSDTLLPNQAAKKMLAIMEHPLNKPIIDRQLNIVTQGYAILQPNIATDIKSASASIFSRIFNDQLGFSPYSRRSSNLYQDFFKQGIFMGKGIYNLKTFEKVLGHSFPENRILSHDLLEGSYLRTAFTSDLNLVDDFPQSYILDASRQYRWTRGDWQLLPYLRRKVIDGRGDKIDNPLSTLSKWQITDNLRRSLLAPSLMMIIFLSTAGLVSNNQRAILFVIVVIFIQSIQSLLILPFSLIRHPEDAKRHLRSFSIVFGQNLMVLVFLPYQAWRMLHAICVTLIRLLITKKNLLQWTTSTAMGLSFKNTVTSHHLEMIASVIQIVLLMALYQMNPSYDSSLFTTLILLWASAPIFAYISGIHFEGVVQEVPIEHHNELGRIARKTYLYFETFSTKQNNYLVPDNYQETPLKSVDNRTSPTNIGFGLCASMSAFDFGYIEIEDLFQHVGATLKSIEKLPKWEGHLYNWYNIKTLEPLHPVYISTVDSGNFVGYLLVVREGLKGALDQVFDYAKSIQGLKDTLACVPNQNSSDVKVIREFINTLDPKSDVETILYTTYPQFKELFDNATLVDTWFDRFKNQVHSSMRTYHDFYPFMDHLKTMPEDVDVEELLDISSQLQKWNGTRECIALYQKTAEELSTLDSSNADTQIWIEGMITILNQTVDDLTVRYTSYVDTIIGLGIIYKETRFEPLYSKKKKLFSIGYDLSREELSNSYYDLMASEARQASYIAIAKGDIPYDHWSSLGRTMASVGHDSGLLSWTGTMFEYLMPKTIMKSYKHTLLYRSEHFALNSQIKYAKQRNHPWGISESQYFAFDSDNKYQYKAMGVPWLAISKKIVDVNVITPYASFLALMVEPKESYSNIQRLKRDGLEGFYGFYEAVEYEGQLKPLIVKSYMAHHQGMSLVSINNYLNNNIMQERFSQDHAMKAYDLLLQEGVPQGKPLVRKLTTTEADVALIRAKQVPPSRRFLGVNLKEPKVHMMSNGNYTVLLSDKGTGYSSIRNADISRWREDKVLDHYGMFFLVEQHISDKRYSSTYAPLNVSGDSYEIRFESNKSSYVRVDGIIETTTEVVVPYEDSVEIRQVTFKNVGDRSESITLTSYFEPILTHQKSDQAHKAFSNLFIETQTDNSKNCIIAKRRTIGDNDEQPMFAYRVIPPKGIPVPVILQTDRNKILARNTSMQEFKMVHPNEYENNTPGAVLDPAISTQVSFDIDAKQTITISYVLMASEDAQTLEALIDKYASANDIKYALQASHNHELISSRYAFLDEKEMILYQNVLSHLVYMSPLKQKEDALVNVEGGKKTLWKYGISGDDPIITLILSQENQMKLLIEVLHAQQYWQMLNYKVDLILIDMSPYSYHNDLGETMDTIISKHRHQTISTQDATIIRLLGDSLEEGDIDYILNSSRLTLDGKYGSLSKQLYDRAE